MQNSARLKEALSEALKSDNPELLDLLRSGGENLQEDRAKSGRPDWAREGGGGGRRLIPGSRSSQVTTCTDATLKY